MILILIAMNCVCNEIPVNGCIMTVYCTLFMRFVRNVCLNVSKVFISGVVYILDFKRELLKWHWNVRFEVLTVVKSCAVCL